MYPLYLIKWTDAIGQDGWATLEDIVTTELSEHVTVGFLVVEKEDAFILTMSYDEINPDNYGAYISIPKVNVKSIQPLFVAPSLVLE